MATKNAILRTEVKVEVTSTMSWKQFATDFGITMASDVRINKNGYPFITFTQDTLGADGKRLAENVYFSKSAAPLVRLEDTLEDIKPLNLQVLELKYPDGTTRLKISQKGENKGYMKMETLWD